MMDNKTAQMLWAAVGWYSGGLDGDIGNLSIAAMGRAENEYITKYTVAVHRMSASRRVVAAAQAALWKLGENPGAIDGYPGHNTREALAAWTYARVMGVREVVSRVPIARPATAFGIPSQRDVETYYGPAGDSMEDNLTLLRLPFKMRIDYNLKQRTNKVRVHKKAAQQLETALIAVHKHYGEEEWRRLGIDRYAGAYNPRRMRGGTAWSMHAYGCAIDFYARPNGLRMRCPKALFCSAPYKAFLDIMEANEWLPALRLWGADAMHFQRAIV